MLMPFGIWTPVGPKEYVLCGVHTAATWRIPLNCPCAAAMRPVVKLLLSLVLIPTVCYLYNELVAAWQVDRWRVRLQGSDSDKLSIRIWHVNGEVTRACRQRVIRRNCSMEFGLNCRSPSAGQQTSRTTVSHSAGTNCICASHWLMIVANQSATH